MQLVLSITESAYLSAVLAALSAFSAVVVVCWPYLMRDTLGVRIQKVNEERQRIRQRERALLTSEDSTASLRQKPKKLFQAIVDRLKLAKQAEDGELANRLKMAGYRGYAPVVTYLAFRLISPVALFAGSGIYLLLILKPESLLTTLAASTAIGSLGYFAPTVYIRNRVAKRQHEIRRNWPDALDLLLISVESGMSIEGAFRKVAEEIGSQSAALAEELTLTTAELSYLQDRRQAFQNLGRRTGVDGVRAVVTSLIQAEKYGTSLGQSLRVMAQENRDMRMHEAEKKAAALPPKLTVPMILFFLPVLFVIILTPAGIQIAGIQ